MPHGSNYRGSGGGRGRKPKEPPVLRVANVADLSSRGTAATKNKAITVGGAQRSTVPASTKSVVPQTKPGNAPVKPAYLAKGIAAGAAPRGRGELRKEPPGMVKRPPRVKPPRKQPPIKVRAKSLTAHGSHNGSIEMVPGLGKHDIAGAVKFGSHLGERLAPPTSALETSGGKAGGGVQRIITPGHPR